MFDEDDVEEPPTNIFLGLEKGLVLQEKNIFIESTLNPRKCCQTITKVLYLLSQGEKFTEKEATELFFAATRLFGSRDIPLRRMVYLLLKELTPIASNVIMIHSSLQKDMNSNSELYKANSIRVICGIVDSSLLGTIERYLKQAIVDKDPYVASAALVSSSFLMKTCHDQIKRWISEIQEALSSRDSMVQYHALGLLYQIRQNDRLAVAKLAANLTKGTVRSPYAQVLLIRIIASMISEEERTGASTGELKTFYGHLENCLRNRHDMVVFEAARSLCALKGIPDRMFSSAITSLQLFLGSGRAVLRFAALRTLSKIAQTYPAEVAVCNTDLENLISDSNRSISTLAVTTLLKTGSENSIERLMKHIGSFMSDISDEFRVIVVEAVRTLCLKFPTKQKLLLSFLSGILRDEGGFDFKRSVVDAILQIVRDLPETKEFALGHLCEFIEDCEFPYLTNKILHLLGSQGPKTAHPSKYIRYIYNRISLEAASVRATAVTALIKFGIHLDSLRPSIIVLLERSLYDNDDEVRDRATFGLKVLKSNNEENNSHFNSSTWNVPWENLEKALIEYQKAPLATPFDIKSVSTVVKHKASSVAPDVSPQTYIKPVEESQELYSTLLKSIPEFSNIGNLFKSSKPAQLTELETEYVINCVKHIFPDFIVLQFNVTNTVKEQLLENLSVKVDISGVKDLKTEAILPIESLPYGPPSSIYVLFKRNAVVTGTLPCSLKYIVKEIDPTTDEPDEEGFDESYSIDPVEVTFSDYMKPVSINNFQEKWEKMTQLVEGGEAFQAINTITLSDTKNLAAAVQKISSHLGMGVVDQTDKVKKSKTHIMHLCGNFLGVPVLTEIKMKLIDNDRGVAVQLVVRSTKEDTSLMIANSV